MSGRNILDRIRRLGWWRFAAGIVAGAAGLGVTLVLRLLGLGVFLPEVAVDFVVGRIPGNIEAIFIQTMGEGAKVLGLATALAVCLVRAPSGGVYSLGAGDVLFVGMLGFLGGALAMLGVSYIAIGRRSAKGPP